MGMHGVTGRFASFTGRSALVALEAAWLSLLFAGCLALVQPRAVDESLHIAASFAVVFAFCGVVTLATIVLTAAIVGTSRVRR